MQDNSETAVHDPAASGAATEDVAQSGLPVQPAAAEPATDAPEAVKEGTPTPQPESKQEAPAEQWVSTGDEVADTAIALLRDGGMSVKEAESVFGKAVQSGNLEDIDVAALEAKLGKQTTTLVLAGVRDWHNRVAAETLRTAQAVKSVVGGDKAWDTLRAWALERETKDAAFSVEMQEYRKMIDQGGKPAQWAAKELLELYNADPKTTGLANKLLQGDARPVDNTEPLSRAEYFKLVTAAEARHDKAEVGRLNARRKAGIAAGV
jgi:hypothetical protein